MIPKSKIFLHSFLKIPIYLSTKNKILVILPMLKVQKSKFTNKQYYLFRNEKHCPKSKRSLFLQPIVENSKTIYDVVNSRRRKVARVYFESLRLQELRPFKILFFPFPFFYVYEERIFSAYHFHFTQMNIGQKIKGKMRRRKSFLLSC